MIYAPVLPKQASKQTGNRFLSVQATQLRRPISADDDDDVLPPPSLPGEWGSQLQNKSQLSPEGREQINAWIVGFPFIDRGRCGPKTFWQLMMERWNEALQGPRPFPFVPSGPVPSAMPAMGSFFFPSNRLPLAASGALPGQFRQSVRLLLMAWSSLSCPWYIYIISSIFWATWLCGLVKTNAWCVWPGTYGAGLRSSFILQQQMRGKTILVRVFFFAVKRVVVYHHRLRACSG